MKRLFMLLLAAISVASITSCGNNGYLADYCDIDDIRDVMLINPVSVIETVSGGDNVTVNDSLSQASQALLLETIMEYNSGLNISHAYVPEEAEEKENILNGVASLCLQVKNSSSDEMGHLAIPAVLDNIIEQSGNRYGMAVIYTGISRTYGNFALEWIKGLGKSLLTLGTVIFIPHRHYGEIHVFIIDSEMDSLVWYNHGETDLEHQKSIKSVFKYASRPFRK